MVISQWFKIDGVVIVTSEDFDFLQYGYQTINITVVTLANHYPLHFSILCNRRGNMFFYFVADGVMELTEGKGPVKWQTALMPQQPQLASKEGSDSLSKRQSYGKRLFCPVFHRTTHQPWKTLDILSTTQSLNCFQLSQTETLLSTKEKLSWVSCKPMLTLCVGHVCGLLPITLLNTQSHILGDWKFKTSLIGFSLNYALKTLQREYIATLVDNTNINLSG